MKEGLVSYEELKDEENEILGVILISRDNRQLDDFGVYRPGKADVDEELFDQIINYAGNDTERNVTVADDLNLPKVNWEGNSNESMPNKSRIIY